LLRQFTILHAESNTKAQFAAAQFADCKASPVTPLTSSSAAAAAFEAMTQLGGSTQIGVGLKEAASLIPRRTLIDARVLILISDGAPSGCGETDADAVATAKEVRQDGIYILPVGVGTNINRALLEQMATDPANVFTVTDYAALTTALDKIVGGACAALQQITTTPCTSAKVSW
jgi:Mg-chelatase subunit ChlD